MQRFKSRVLSVILALTMACALLVALPTAAHAAGPDTPDTCEVWSGVVNGSYTAATLIGTYSFNDALEAVLDGDGETIKLLANIDFTGDLTIDLDGVITPAYHANQFTIHTNGFILEISGDLILLGDDAFLMIEAGGNTALPDGKFIVGGDVIALGLDLDDLYSPPAGMQFHNAAVVSHGATIEIGGSVYSSAHGVTSERGGNITIAGGIYADGYGVYANNPSSVSVGTPGMPMEIVAGDFGINALNGATVIVYGDIYAYCDNMEYAIGNMVLIGTATDALTTITVHGNVYTECDGIWAAANLVLTINGNIEAGWAGIYAEESIITVNGNIEAYDGPGVSAWDATVTVEGNIDASGNGIYASGTETTVIVNGNITSGENGVIAVPGATVTVEGDIDAYYDGVHVYGDDVTVTVTGDIFAGDFGVVLYAWEGSTSNADITINGNIYAFYCGVGSFDAEESMITVNGDIEAGYGGVVVFGDVLVFINGNIVVTGTEPLYEDDVVVGVIAAFGAQVTVDGTITVEYGLPDVYYIILAVMDAGGSWYSFEPFEPGDIFSPSSKDNFFEYNDSDFDVVTSYVWVRDPRTLVPPTGDNTSLWLMIGSLMIAAIGTGCVLAYRRREQKEV